jgi:hypothetical protein
MDMDDDFMGEVEFNLSAAQGEIVNRAVSLASSLQGDAFAQVNPLIAIMQWWQTNVPEAERAGTTPEARLAEACVRFLDAHTR